MELQSAWLSAFTEKQQNVSKILSDCIFPMNYYIGREMGAVKIVRMILNW